MKNLLLGFFFMLATAIGMASNGNLPTKASADLAENFKTMEIATNLDDSLEVSYETIYNFVNGAAVSCTLTATFEGDGCSGSVTVTAETCAAAAAALAKAFGLCGLLKFIINSKHVFILEACLKYLFDIV